MRGRAPLLGLMWLVACAETVQPQPVNPPIDPTFGMAESGVVCDAGDRAFVRRVVFDLFGRRVLGVREVDVLARVVSERGRAGLVAALLEADATRTHWEQELRDLLFINRAGSRANEECFGPPQLAGAETDALARHVRDNAPDGLPFDAPWNMTDLVRSALVLDDLAPVLSGHVFTQLGSEIIDADDPNDELAWRTAYADLFVGRLLNRRLECLTCHNSEFSVTGDPDPALDRTWEVPGQVERAVFGASIGRAAADIATLFRIKDVLAMTLDEDGPEFWLYGEGVSPWGLEPGCGQFVARDAVPEDFLGGSGALVHEWGPRASIWDLEGLLRAAFAKLRGRVMTVSASGQVDGEEALAWMLAMGLSERVWERVMGAPLTMPFGLPRNRYQRDVLAALSRTFVESGYSLRALLSAIVLHPYYNQSTPDRCGLATPYYLSPLFDPWVVDHDDQEQRNNSAGELLRRAPARVLITAVTTALEWSAPRSFFPDEEAEGVQLPEDAAFQRDLGAFVRDGETGFRGSNFQETLAWEFRYGACEDPEGDAPDFVDALVAAAGTRPIEHAVVALKDRLIAEPTLQDQDERALMESLLGVPLSTPTTGLEAPLRRVCSALLASPQFVLEGVSADAPPDAPVDGLVPPGADAAALCARLAAAIPGASCTGDRLVVP